MSMSDNIADMLTRIRNAQQSKLLSVVLPASKMKSSVLDVLKKEGYIQGYSRDENSSLVIILKYSSAGEPAISEIHRVSRPGKRVYSSISKLPKHFNGLGIYIISTSSGLVSDKVARSMKIGGEVVCKVF